MAHRPSSTALTIGSLRGSASVYDAAPRLASWPHVALAALLALTFAIYVALAHATPAPRVFLDELTYLDAAGSLAHGDGLEARDGAYGFALLYPIVLAPLLATFDREAAYELVKALNALLFALAAVPVYLLARRVLMPWHSVAVAALSIVIPSAMYVSVVMTESLAYVVACWAMYAMVRALEHPSVSRQATALGAIGFAYLARPQFLVLYAAFVLALVAVAVLTRTFAGRIREHLVELWPTLLAGAAGLGVLVVRPAVRGTSPSESLGEYSGLWRAYSPLDIGRYLLYELANLELYLAVVPVVVAPVVVAAFVRGARRGDRRQAAFLALFLSVNACLLALVAAFDSIEFRYLHDRYLFYLVPLWLIVLFAWLVSGARTPRVALAIGVALALVPILLPLGDMQEHTGGWRFNALGSSLPRVAADAVGSPIAARVLLAALGLALAIVAFRLRSSAGPVVVLALAVAFAVNGAAAWATAFDPPQTQVFPGSSPDRRWVDREVSDESSVTMLYVPCEGLVTADKRELTANSFLVTEFFNSSIGETVLIGGEGSGSARLSASGEILASSRERLEADYVVAQPGIRVRGQRVGEGTQARLVLWRVEGPVGLDGVGAIEGLRSAACGAA